MLFKRNGGSFEWLIVGLGNPGLEYEKTRHNAGFIAIDALAKKHNCDFSRRKHDALFGDAVIAGKKVILAKPQTYMNNSGRAVLALAQFYKIPLDKIIIMFDDISLEIGKIRIRRKGSAGGHNGIKDIIEVFGSQDIPRIKIGVGAKPNPDYDLKNWVLGKLPKESEKEFSAAVDNAVCGAEEILSRGIDSAMNKYSK